MTNPQSWFHSTFFNRAAGAITYVLAWHGLTNLMQPTPFRVSLLLAAVPVALVLAGVAVWRLLKAPRARGGAT